MTPLDWFLDWCSMHPKLAYGLWLVCVLLLAVGYGLLASWLAS